MLSLVGVEEVNHCEFYSFKKMNSANFHGFLEEDPDPHMRPQLCLMRSQAEDLAKLPHENHEIIKNGYSFKHLKLR